MKKIIAISILACFTLIAVNAQAQVKFGPQVSLNISDMMMKTPQYKFSTKNVVKYSVGIISELNISNHFLVQPGLIYSVKGTKYLFLNQTNKLEPSYLEIPVNFMYQFDVKPAKLDVFAGPYFAYGIGGKVTYNGGNSTKINYGTGTNDNLRRFDYGLNFGIGIDVINLELKAQYGLGLANLSPVSSNTIKMARVISISLSYLL